MTEEIEWTKEKLNAFEKVYKKNKDKEVFVFEGAPFIPDYAKYLIEYLKTKL